MLEWLTFAAAVIAAAASIVSSVLTYRSTTRGIASTERTAAAEQQQQQVDTYVGYALSDDPRAVALGVRQLNYLLASGHLTPEQRSAAAAAITSTLFAPESRAELAPDARIEFDPGPPDGVGEHTEQKLEGGSR